MKTLTVVVPAYNEEKCLPACLASLLSDPPENLNEIIVVDNASTDKTAEIAAGFPRVRVVFEPQKGLTRARQKGLLSARADIIAYVDADTRISPDWYRVINREFSGNGNIVCLSGPYQYDGLKWWEKIFVSFFWVLIFLIYYLSGKVVIGGNFAAAKRALEKMGGFDSKIAFYGEDTDIARRISKIGKIRFIKGFSLKTSPRRFTKDGLFRTGIRYALNYFWTIFFHKPLSREYQDIR